MSKKVAISLAILAISNFTLAQDFAELKLKNSVAIIDQETFGAESVAISDDGSKLCWIAKSRDSKIVIPGDIFVKDFKGEEVRRVKKGSPLNAFTKCSFDQDNNLVASKLHWRPLALSRTIVVGLIRGDFDPIGYVSSITTLDESDKAITVIKPKDLDLKSNRTFLKHPRISPNGQWLTYYLKSKKLEGVYVHHLKSGKTFQLSDVYDKHPTWTPDGSKILFHYQIDATETQPEMAYLGYFDLKLDDKGELISKERVLLDDPNKVGFRYQKHPAVLAGTNYVFFHGEIEAGDKKSLFVRRLTPNSTSHELKLEVDGKKITKAKHPASGAFDDTIVFIGKTKGQENDMVLRLKNKALNKIIETLK